MSLGALAGMAGTLGSLGAQFGLNYASAKQAQDFAKDMFQNRFQWMMKDMKKAGLNPILAYREAGPGTPSASGGFQPPQVPDMGSSARAAMLELQSLEKLKADTAKSNAEATLIEKQVPRAEMERDLWERGAKVFDRVMNWFDSGGPEQFLESGARQAAPWAGDVKAKVTDAVEQLEQGVQSSAKNVSEWLSSADEWVRSAVKDGLEAGRAYLEENSPAWKVYKWLTREEPPRKGVEEKRGGKWTPVERPRRER